MDDWDGWPERVRETWQCDMMMNSIAQIDNLSTCVLLFLLRYDHA